MQRSAITSWGLETETTNQVHSHVERLGCNSGAWKLLVTLDASREIPMLQCYSLTCVCLSKRQARGDVSLAKLRRSFKAGPLLSARLLPDPGKRAPFLDGAWQSRRRAGTLHHADRAVGRQKPHIVCFLELRRLLWYAPSLRSWCLSA